jgi:hypothetical protein
LPARKGKDGPASLHFNILTGSNTPNAMNDLPTAIVYDDAATVKVLLKRERELATRRISQPRLYDLGIFHWLYVGDTRTPCRWVKAEILKT